MLKSFGYNSYIMGSLEKKVEKLYNQIDVYAASDLCMEQIAHSLGIHLYIMPGGSKSVILNGTAYIFLDSSLNDNDRWEDFGHELGHVLYHSGNQRLLTKYPDFINYQEWEADLFAFHFCVPTFMLLQSELPNDCRSAVHYVSQQFNVSYSFAHKRLKMLKQKIIDQQFHVALWKSIRKDEIHG